MAASRPPNPHFDEGLLVWEDEYSGRYQPPPTGYGAQFDLQWQRALEDSEYFNHPGASLDDVYIDDRIYELTGRHPRGEAFHDPSAGTRVLDRPLQESLIRDKSCIDIGCGMGRWTKTLMKLGARSVLSVDMSESALKSVRSFNQNARQVDITDIPNHCPDLVGQFDLAMFWGVAMCTHDPLKAFMSAASTVKPGGSLYVMVYAPEGEHNTKVVNVQRAHFARLDSVRERLAYVDHVAHRDWDASYPLRENLKNLIRRSLGWSNPGKLGVLDMLEPFYNWVIPLPVLNGWMERAGFGGVQFLNEFEKSKTAYHMLGTKRSVPAPAVPTGSAYADPMRTGDTWTQR